MKRISPLLPISFPFNHIYIFASLFSSITLKNSKARHRGCQGSMKRKRALDAMTHAHLGGKKHKAKQSASAAARKDQGASVATETRDPIDPLHCRICDVRCNSEAAMEGHLNGRKHAGKRFTAADARGRGDRAVKQEWWCGACKVGCNSEAMMEAHLDGKRHKAKEAKESLRTRAKRGGAVEEEDACDDNAREEAAKVEGVEEEASDEKDEEMRRVEMKKEAKEAKPGSDEDNDKVYGGNGVGSNGTDLQDPKVRQIKETQNKEFWCMICRVKYCSQLMMVIHLKGADHKAKLSQLRGWLDS